MNRFLMIGLLAVGATALSQQQASAWTKFNFSVGLNLSWESGNNSFLWGLWNNGQSPGYPTDILHHRSPIGYPNYSYAMPSHPEMVYAPAAPHAAQPAPTTLPAPRQYQTPEPPRGNASQSSWYGSQNGYQPVGYSYPTANYYYQTPGYQSSWAYQVPSYWYGY